MNSKGPIPPSVVKRMTKYLAYVQGLCEDNVAWVSSSELADTLGMTSSTVRQDLSHLDFSGTSKRGYETAGLAQVLVKALGVDEEWRMAVAGAGNLGRALVLHRDFERRGFRICAIFDNDKRKIGTRVGALTVQGMRELPTVVQEQNIQLGVIAVPPAAAQSVADIMIASRMRGLLNLALTHIIAPRQVAVIDARIAASLLELSYAVKTMSEPAR
jgi:redox-sensing transcriptional repressor